MISGCIICTQNSGENVIPERKPAPPGTSSACAVVITGDIYMFGGYVNDKCDSHLLKETNAVWKLTRKSKQCFKRRKGMEKRKKKIPSPRYSHTGWEYTGQLWTLGGCAYGSSEAGYLNDHGDFVRN